MAISTQEIESVASDIGMLNVTQDEIQYVKDNFRRIQDEDPTGYWQTWVEDLLHEIMY